MTTDVSSGSVSTSTAIVEIDSVTHEYRSRGTSVVALEDVTLAFAAGDFVSIVGPSGCGKTTLLQLLGGFIQPSVGEVRVAGARVEAPGPDRGVVFQQPNLYPWLSVRGNVEFGPRMRHRPKRERRADADRYLRLVGLEAFADARPYELSGGMQQRAQIARVLVNRPEIMLLDEPFAALDALTRERLQDELHAIWAADQRTAVFVTHNVEEATYLSTRIIVLSPRPGRVVLDVEAPFARSGRSLEELRRDPSFVELQSEVRGAIRER